MMCVGHCVVGKYLVLFLSSDDSAESEIVRIEKTTDGFKYIILYYDDNSSLFNINAGVDCFGYYESSLIQKVYWTDGIS
jgi:hypothetical protein